MDKFTYIPDILRRGDKSGIALLTAYEEGVVSNVYMVFEIMDEHEIISAYLMLWFRRSKFNRYARLQSYESVREVEVMDWNKI